MSLTSRLTDNLNNYIQDLTGESSLKLTSVTIA